MVALSTENQEETVWVTGDEDWVVDATEVGYPQEQIVRWTPSEYYPQMYTVQLSLEVEAETANEAMVKAVRFRNVVGGGMGSLDDLDFDWDLHDPDGC